MITFCFSQESMKSPKVDWVVQYWSLSRVLSDLSFPIFSTLFAGLIVKGRLSPFLSFLLPSPIYHFFPFTSFHCGLLTSPQSYKSKILEEMLLWEC